MVACVLRREHDYDLSLGRLLSPPPHAALVGNVILSKEAGERALLGFYLETIYIKHEYGKK